MRSNPQRGLPQSRYRSATSLTIGRRKRFIEPGQLLENEDGFFRPIVEEVVVFTVPKRLRLFFKYDRRLLGGAVPGGPAGPDSVF